MSIFFSSKLRYFRQLYYFFQLKRHQWLEEKDLIRIQERRLRWLINNAYKNVPFYHDLFNSVGIKPKDINSVNDLQKIPILTKDIVRKNYPDKIVSKEVNITNCIIKNTTGSTGMPLKVAFKPKMIDYQESLSFFVFVECGLRLTDKLAVITPRDYQSSLSQSLFQKIGLLKWKSISLFNPIESILESLKNFNPDVLAAYPSILLLLSKEIKEQNIGGINPRLILTSGESLTDYNRNQISKIFNSDIYQLYGTVEFGRLAFECENYSGNHIINDTAIIEAVNGEKNVAEGEKGEIVVTTLYNYVMPLIRYKLGDIVTISNKKCACGRALPLIKSIEGRTDDFFILPSGRKISPRNINISVWRSFIEEIHGISRYQTIQEAKNKITVNIIRGSGFSEQTIGQIKKNIKECCHGEDVQVNVKLVDELSRNKSGKLRSVISNVKE